jgi:hypothetical protein
MKKTLTQKKKPWPWGKSVPSFKSEADEIAFWQAHEFEPPPSEVGEMLVYEPQATRHPRNHVYRIRLDDQEMALLQKLAQRRGTPASVVLRMLIREQAAVAS